MSDQLPPTWALATLEQLFAPLEDGRLLHHGWSPQCDKEPAGSDDEWGVLKTTAIQPGAFLPEHNKRLPPQLNPRPQHEVKVGDLLITCAGPRVRCGIPCLVKSTRPKLMLSGKMYRFRVPEDFVDAGYVEKYLLSQKAQVAIDAMKTGGSDSGLNLTHDRFKPLPVPLAPTNEQRRIASKIDELFSRIDEGERALERVQKLVERYRQSILKAAVTGELTRDWREKNKDKLGDSIEGGEALLARILKARREAWEKSELDKMKAKGITPANDKWKQKYEEPPAPDTTGLPKLPQGWSWATAETLTEAHRSITYGVIKLGDEVPGGVPTLRSSNVRHLFNEVEYVKTISTKIAAQYQRTFLEGGEVLITVRGTLGGVSVAPPSFGGWNVSREIAVLFPTEKTLSGAIAFFIGSPILQNWLTTRTKGIAYTGINIETLKRLPIPVPSLSEAIAIADKISQLLSAADSLISTREGEHRRLVALRQTLLSQAFQGCLVHQDPSDEPASQLLERIAAERADAPAKPKRGRKPKTQEPA